PNDPTVADDPTVVMVREINPVLVEEGSCLADRPTLTAIRAVQQAAALADHPPVAGVGEADEEQAERRPPGVLLVPGDAAVRRLENDAGAAHGPARVIVD